MPEIVPLVYRKLSGSDALLGAFKINHPMLSERQKIGVTIPMYNRALAMKALCIFMAIFIEDSIFLNNRVRCLAYALIFEGMFSIVGP